MPCATRRWVGKASRLVRSISTIPLAGMAPMIARNKVVLPDPLRPISPHISLCSIASEALRTIGIGPIDTLSSAILNMSAGTCSEPHLGAADQCLNAGIGQRRGGRAIGNNGSIVKCQYTLGKALDDVHVVLHEQHGDLTTKQCRHDDLHKVELLFNGNATGRFVKQQQAR